MSNFWTEQERFHELTGRDLLSRTIATLQAGGMYDSSLHSDPQKYPPLTVAEHLEVLALGELIAGFYRHPAHVRLALAAGATWHQVAAATGTDEEQVRHAYQGWVANQDDPQDNSS
jgi:hypothetical protein